MLLNEFSVVFDRPEKVKKLREYILSLAVRGKLVEQDENDESASMLLQKIREDKERLVKEKKIKKEKQLDEISEEEIPYGLPNGWQWVRLGELGNIFNGNSINAKLKESKYSNIKEGYNYIATKDVDLQSRMIDYENGIKIPFDEEKFRVAHEGAILICAEGGSAGKKIGLVGEDICFGNKLLAIELFYETNSKYLFYLYQSPDFYERFSELMTGIIGGISSKNFKEIPVSLPPLNEQNKIVAKVDYLMEFCDKLEVQLEKKMKFGSLSAKSALNSVSNCSTYDELEEVLRFIINNFNDLISADGAIDELKSAILSLAVKGKLVPQDNSDESASVLIERVKEEKDRLIKEKVIKKEKPFPEISNEEIPYELPSGWKWVRLGELCKLITKGSSPKWQGINYIDNKDGVLFITSENVGKFNIILNNKKYLEYRFNEIEPRSILEKGDLLTNIVGASIGRTAIYDLDEVANINQAVCIIRTIDNSVYKPYLLNFLNSSICIGYMYDKQVDCARANLSMSNIARFLIPIPPIEEQKRIVEKADRLMKVCDKLGLRIEKSKKYSEKLMDSILKDSFKA